LHFDIIVPDTVKEPAEIFGFGKTYLQEKGEDPEGLSAAECRFCHIEEPSQEMLAAIGQQGYYILEMDPIPASLGAGASRRDMILHLKGYYPAYRFRNFSGIPEEEVRTMLLNAENE